MAGKSSKFFRKSVLNTSDLNDICTLHAYKYYESTYGHSWRTRESSSRSFAEGGSQRVSARTHFLTFDMSLSYLLTSKGMYSMFLKIEFGTWFLGRYSNEVEVRARNN